MILTVLATGLASVAPAWPLHAQSRLPVERPAFKSSLYRCAIRQDGSLCAGVRNNGRVELYDADLAKLVELEPKLDAVCLELAFSPNGEHLSAQTSDGRLLLWGVGEAGLEQATLARVITQLSLDWHRPRSYEAGLTWSPDSTRILTIDGLGHRSLFNAEGDLVRRLNARGYEDGAFDALWHEPTRALLLRDASGVGLYDWDTGEPRMVGAQHEQYSTAKPPTAFALIPDGSLLAIGSEHLHVDLFDLDTGALCAELDYSPGDWLVSEDAHPLQLRFAPDGKQLALSSYGSAYVAVMDSETLHVTYDSGYRGCHWNEVYQLRWRPTSDRIMCYFDCGSGGTSELTLGEEPKWQSFDRLVGPRFSATTGVGILDGELTSWQLFE